MTDRERLAELIRLLSYEFREITLASGLKSNFYFDGKQTSLNAEGATLIGRLFYDRIIESFPGTQAVGGPTLGADPLVVATSIRSFELKLPLPSFIIRKEPKGHGTQAWIEGVKNLRPGMKVVLLEDVVTTGGSVIQAAERARAAGLNILGCLILVDRQEGGREALSKAGLRMESLFTKADICRVAA